MQKESSTGVGVTGRTAAVNLVNVTARVNGYIVSILFKEGDVVACMAHDAAVANIRKPTLVRVGPEERFFSIEEARQLAGMIPGVRCKILAEGAHNAWMKYADELTSRALSVLGIGMNACHSDVA